MDITTRKVADVTIVDFKGRLAVGVSDSVLPKVVGEILNDGSKKILLNLGGVKNIDSSGIGELIANYTTVSRDGGQLKLLNLTDKIQNLLVITKLLTVFDSFDNETDALNSFK